MDAFIVSIVWTKLISASEATVGAPDALLEASRKLSLAYRRSSVLNAAGLRRAICAVLAAAEQLSGFVQRGRL